MIQLPDLPSTDWQLNLEIYSRASCVKREGVHPNSYSKTMDTFLWKELAVSLAQTVVPTLITMVYLLMI